MELWGRNFVIREHARQRSCAEIIDPEHCRQKRNAGAAEHELIGEQDVVAVHGSGDTYWLGAAGPHKRPDPMGAHWRVLDDAFVLLQVARAAEQGMRLEVCGSSE